jgi:phospholipid/cholesterol/gamma-HCH transport system substrate-binding protein
MPSPRRQGRRTLVGALNIVGLIALASAIFFLDRIETFFRRTYTVVAVFPEAPGLRPGSPVWVAGVPVGTIRDIALLPPGDTAARVALDMELDRSVASQIRKDSRIHFASSRMIGEQVVELIPGSARSPVLQDGDTIRVGRVVAPEELVASVKEVRLSLDSLMLESRGLRRQAATRQPQVRRVLREAALARQELAEVRRSLAGGGLSKLMSLQAAGGPLDRVQRRAAEVQRLVGRSHQRAAQLQRESAPQQRTLTASTRQLQADIAALRALMAQPAGTLARVRGDSALQQALLGTSARLDSLIAESRRNPLRFIF